MLVKSRHPEPPPAIRKIANAFRILGWVAFWVQLVMAFVAGIALIFTATGRSFSPDTSAGTGIGIFWAVCGILLLVAGIVFDFQYVRISKGLRHEPGAVLHPKRLETIQFLRLGAFIGFSGMLLSLIGSGISVGVLVAKTVSQPPGVAIIDPNKIVRALDVFVVLANINLTAAHLVGTVASFWLLDRVHHYQHPPHQ
ncbi:DUF3611 family protein [Pseudanabaena sp. PCC 6802]|uniref:DUF3611 family protein n=1 Tax=Pseudanabaena sp. PCC 6802 TaxID=118173 RepID=UPI00034922B8|nr:DUF3611 family protein [Pseudanabaena sp. PCC 6802]